VKDKAVRVSEEGRSLINQWKETHKLKDGVSINFEDAEVRNE